MRKANQYYREVEMLKRMTLIFHGMTKHQVALFLQKSEEEALFIMKCFGRMRKGYFDEVSERIAEAKQKVGFSSKALTVYLDFYKNGIAGTPFSSKAPFIACVFFDVRDEILYEIIHIPFGEENLACKLIQNGNVDDGEVFSERRRIVIIDSLERKEFALLSDVFTYCDVNADGKVIYYG